jgi:membrane-associated PAP2 superfamily phosphatase
MRGAHFWSHDLWSLAVCWLVVASLARVWAWPVPSTIVHDLSHTNANAEARA